MSEEPKEVIKSVWEELRKTIMVETAIGKPIEIEDKTLIPIFAVGFGAGGGGGGRGKEKEGQGYGVGGGGGITPIALVAVFKGIPGPDGMKVLSLKPSGAIERIVGEALPMVMEKIKEMKEEKEGKKAEEKR
ncbi:MAG: spore germination protein GerW family protein [Methanophagales archaeon]|nr:spore germination protein GerW family protein [Methanophagales archaeon]MCW3141570.1 spore germination protein GerW family protein [Methanophagales archaeon]